MNNAQGFSLIEVLISLLLISTVSLALLHQQWQLSQVLNLALQRSMALTHLDNNSERLLAGLPLAENEKPFQLRQSTVNRSILLVISWEVPASTNRYNLQRQLAVFQ